MRQARKEELLRGFPAVPQSIMETMKGRLASNFAVFLTEGNELFVRCFHRYSDGKLIERQRYVFAKDGSVRWGKNDGAPWTLRKEFREPVFCQSCYGYNFDNSYRGVNMEAIGQSCMKYCCHDLYTGDLLMEYLHLYCRHPNVEYIMKSGYRRHGRWIEDRTDVICSSCGCRYNGELFCMSHEDDAFSRCPKCGAKLDLRTPIEAALDMADSVMMGGAENVYSLR